MFEKKGRRCPRCGYEIRDQLQDEEVFVCSVCQSSFRVMLDKTTGRAAFCEEAAREMPEPLYLPKGSVRALAALTMSACCWILIFAARELPAPLPNVFAHD